MDFQFKCPQCGQIIEGDDSFSGQVAPCPFCEKNIVIPKAKPLVTVSKPKPKQPVTWKRTQPSISQGTSGHAPMGGLSNTEPPPQKGFLRKRISPRGRTSRKEFWIINGIAVIFVFFSTFLTYLEKQGLGHIASFIRAPLIPLSILVGVFSWCLWTRRLHDLNRSDYWLLPLIGGGITCKVLGTGQISAILMYLLWLAWFIVLGSLDGTPGDNDYGSDPRGRVGTGEQTNTSKIAIWILSAVSAVVSVIAIAARNLMPETAPREDMEQRELRQSASDENDGESSSDDVDMVTVGGVSIRKLPDVDFVKGKDDDGTEMFTATLPERDGFTPFITITFEHVRFDAIPLTPQQMRNFTAQDVRVALDEVISNIAKELKNQGIDVTIGKRSGNAVSIVFWRDKSDYGYQKNILDTQNGRMVYVCGIWNSDQDKEIIKACVDSARLAAP